MQNPQGPAALARAARQMINRAARVVPEILSVRREYELEYERSFPRGQTPPQEYEARLHHDVDVRVSHEILEGAMPGILAARQGEAREAAEPTNDVRETEPGR